MHTALNANRHRVWQTALLHRLVASVAALMLLNPAAPVAAQQTTSDHDLRNRQHSGGLSGEDRKRFDALKQEDARYDAAAAAESKLRNQLLRLPPLPVERNGLLGSWRQEGGGQMGAILGSGATTGGDLIRELGTALLSNPEKLLPSTCVTSFGNGVTFTPSTFSIRALDGSTLGGPIAYRSSGKQGIWVIPDSVLKIMVLEVAGPDRIVLGGSCALVRVGAPAAKVAANAMTSPSQARAGPSMQSSPSAGALPQVAAAAPALPRSTLSRPSPEVCRNTLLDKLGVVGTNQVRAMSDARFKEAAIEGKVPKTNNLRIDLRGSACHDPRIKATLYDFDADEMLQSITYVWDRPPGPAPAPIFAERVATLSRFHPTLPQPQATGRLQGDTAFGRLILQDMPERNLLLEAHSVRK